MRHFMLVAIALTALVPSAAAQTPVLFAQDWQQWHKQNPTYPEGTPKPKAAPTPAATPEAATTPKPKTTKKTKSTPAKDLGYEGMVEVLEAKVRSKMAARDLDNVLEGTIRNQTNVPVQSIKIYFSVVKGTTVLESSSVEVYPKEVEPGDKGTFAKYVAKVGNVEIHKLTWRWPNGDTETLKSGEGVR